MSVAALMAADAKRGWNNANSTMVKNINGTSDPHYKIAGLHGKYKSMGGTDSGACQVKECHEQGHATAHVQLADGRSRDDWYLCWVCSLHNSSSYTAPYGLRSNAKLISVKELRARFG